jgi:hypothetical protein
MFEASDTILKRDPKSLLAQLCSEEPPILPDPEGFYYFDRDWWLFRYVMIFLRDGSLPSDRSLLAQLYREAGFWHLNELQIAIEEDKLHLRKNEKDVKKDIWWRNTPSYLQAIDEVAAANKTKEENKTKSADWWKDTSYNGIF